ncbi:rhamnogalacturonate lyase [Drechslerella dactyloides]|uniref:Rhamnogalacturonate lyase n=1 Tax=Drechslerella dactyloides TaxID=74499 RepID=A0AAD6NHW0_DREDA|nr:rhamnogalacturonate lyase [Drechslerella dactyloides]
MSDSLDALFNRKPPTWFERFAASPQRFVAETLYQLRPNHRMRTRPLSMTISSKQLHVVCLSDSHNHEIQNVPDGDILIHAGDLTNRGTVPEVQAAIDWLDALPHKYKIVIAGNHELCLDSSYQERDTAAYYSPPDSLNWKSLLYLNDSSAVISIPGKSRPVKVYGNPWTPKQGNWAFQYLRSEDFWKDKIPADVDILVTHGPPRHYLDNHAGCISLLQDIWRVRPKLHVFGHIHSARGYHVLDFTPIQKKYEILSDGRGGVWEMIVLAWSLVVAHLLSLAYIREGQHETILINAAMVKGLKNDSVHDDVATATMAL